jgi:hypothetical protein
MDNPLFSAIFVRLDSPIMKLKALVGALFLCSIAHPGFGYSLEGENWTLDRTVQFQLSLGPPTNLIDGFPSFNESAADALNIWNSYLVHLHCTSVLNSPTLAAAGDDENSAFFSRTIYGDDFGTGVLAITLLNFRDTIFEESDTIFNSAYTWNSYRGPINGSLIDFHRVAIHEFGHALGLDHPDDAGQQVSAIMNSHISDIDTVQQDDINGIAALYNNGPDYQESVPGPILANISTRALIGTGDNVLIGGFIVQGSQPATVILRAVGYSLSASGFTTALFDPTITLYDASQHQIASNDDWAFSGTSAETIASYQLDPPNSRESALYVTLQPGAYTAIVQSYSDAQTPPGTGIGLFELYDLHTNGGRAGNISTRGQVLGGDNILIGGFIVGGTDPKTITARAIGPSLGTAGVSNPLSDPILDLRDSNGDLVQSNDDWQQGPDHNAISAEGLAPVNPKESALLATLSPAAYTVLVSGVNGATGIGLVEIYDNSPAP